MSELTQQGIAAIKAGDKENARRLLISAVRQTPNDVQAWLWLAAAMERDEQRLDCLRQVLKIDPSNAAAARGLLQIAERQSKKAAASGAPVPAPTASAAPVTHVPPIAAAPAIEPAPPIQRPAAQQPLPPAQFTNEPPPATQPLVEVPAPQVQPQAEYPASPPPTAFSLEEQPAPESVPQSHPLPRPTPRRKVSTHAVDFSGDPGKRIFRTRPSIAVPLLTFWVLIFGLWGTVSLLWYETPPVKIMLALTVCPTVGIVMSYVMIRLFATRYELTTRGISMPLRGKRTDIPISDIFDVYHYQGLLQRLMGIGDIYIEASVAGELCRLRMQNVTDFKHRAEQILYLVRDQA